MDAVTTAQPTAASALPTPAHCLRASDGRLVEYSPLQLLVMQSTPLCNIDCAYCYLPDRQNPKRMRMETVDAVYSDLMTARFVGKQFTTVWHAGEPLTLSLIHI